MRGAIPLAHQVSLEELTEYVEGRLAPAEAARIEAHVATGCPRCAQDLTWLRRVLGLMASDQLVNAPAALIQRVEDLYRVPRHRPLAAFAGLWPRLRPPLARQIAAVAVAAVLILSGTWVWSNTSVAQAATLADMQGAVEVRLPGSAVWQPATVGQALTAGSALRVGEGAVAIVLYTDGSRSYLGGSAKVEFLDLMGPRSGKAATVRLAQTAGHTQHELASAHSSVQVEVASAVAQAVAAGFEVWVDGEEMDVQAGRGHVNVRVGQDQARVAPGQRGRVAKGDLSVTPLTPEPGDKPSASPEPSASPAPASGRQPPEGKPGPRRPDTPPGEGDQPAPDRTPPSKGPPARGDPSQPGPPTRPRHEDRTPRPTPRQRADPGPRPRR